MSDLLERLFNYDRATAAYDMIEAAKRIEALEAALREIVASSKRKGPPDFQYWLDVANDRREIARAALAPEQDK